MTRSVYWLTLLLSACSIVYELVLAQTMGALLGNTFLRYNVTIGIFLAALGVGSLLCTRSGTSSSTAQLIRIEWMLASLGAAGPLLLFAWDAAVFKVARAMGLPFDGVLCRTLIYAFDHAIIVAIGVLSGFELPLLMRLGGPQRSEKVLAVDYAGTLLGSVAFPLLLLPGLGLLATASVIGLINALCALYLAWKTSSKKLGDWAASIAAAAIAGGLLIGNAAIERAVSNGLSFPPP